MQHDPQGYRTDDLGLPLDSGVASVRPSLPEQQALADEGHAAYLCSHGLWWPAERPDDPERTGWPMVEH
jgi:hypothetical protein